MLVLLLGGCASGWQSETTPRPQSYTPPPDLLQRGAGALRRLWLLPAEISSSDCPASPDDAQLARRLDAAVPSYLRDWKGYEPVAAPAFDAAAAVSQLGTWQAGDSGDGTPPQGATLDAVRLAAQRAGADGFVVLHGRLRCLNTTDIVLYFMIVGMPNWRSKLMDENLSAGVYETDSGRLVWKRRVNVSHPAVGGGSYPEAWVGLLFDTLENALPAVLLP